MIAKVENGVVTQWPLGENFIQSAHPNTSFSFPLNDATLSQFGFAKFSYSDQPEHDAEFQEVREVTPTLSGGVATQSWEVVEKYTAEEKTAYVTKREAETLDTKKAAVRSERNAKLAASDWTQGKDIPDAVSTPWAAYRQALRNITTQTGFPWEVQWPTQPE